MPTADNRSSATIVDKHFQPLLLSVNTRDFVKELFEMEYAWVTLGIQNYHQLHEDYLTWAQQLPSVLL